MIDTKWFTEEGRERGRIVHRLCELIDKGTLDHDSIDPRLWGWVDAYQAFKAELKPEILLNEQRLHHPMMMYGGTLDRLLRFKDKHLSLLDIKSGSPEDWAMLQMSGYELMLTVRREYFGIPIQRHALELRENGTYNLIPYRDPTDHHVFAGMVATANWMVKHGRATYN